MGAQAGSQCTGFNTAAAAHGHAETTPTHQPREIPQCAKNKGKGKKTRKENLSPFSPAIGQSFLSFIFPPRCQYDRKSRLLERLSKGGYTIGEENFKKSWGALAWLDTIRHKSKGQPFSTQCITDCQPLSIQSLAWISSAWATVAKHGECKIHPRAMGKCPEYTHVGM